MIDLHSHPLPGLDDGAADLSTSLKMARACVAQGVTVVACTPHVLPGVYHTWSKHPLGEWAVTKTNSTARRFRYSLSPGADVHMAQHLIRGVALGRSFYSG